MPDTILMDVEERMEKAIDVLHHELATIRTGRANASILDRVKVDYYGSPTPITQMSSVSTPEARVMVIKPFDKSMLKAVEKAINESDIGINPQSDGQIIRLAFPQLTEERRRELAKSVHKYGESAKVAIRNIRRDGNDSLKKLEKDSTISEDDLKGYTEDVQTLTDGFTKQIDEIVVAKEKDITTV